MNPDVLTLIAILTPAVTFGVAYGGTRAAQNGIYKQLSRIEKTGDSNAQKLAEHGERLVRIETKIEDMPRSLPEALTRKPAWCASTESSVGYFWRWQNITLEHFKPEEFSRPELMDGEFLRDLDTLRERCGFGLRVTSDARSVEQQATLYAHDSDKVPSSAHLDIGNVPVRCVDVVPVNNTERNQLKLTYEILRLWSEGVWPKLGLGVETAHWHIDDTPRLGAKKRPAFWVAASK